MLHVTMLYVTNVTLLQCAMLHVTMLIYSYICIFIVLYKYTNVQYKNMNIYTNRYTNMHIYKYINMHIYRYTNKHKYKYTKT